jgi:hypothetical protein
MISNLSRITEPQLATHDLKAIFLNAFIGLRPAIYGGSYRRCRSASFSWIRSMLRCVLDDKFPILNALSLCGKGDGNKLCEARRSEIVASKNGNQDLE